MNDEFYQTLAEQYRRQAKDFLGRLSLIMRPEVIPRWLEQNNPAFDNKSPMDLIISGEYEPLIRMLYYLEGGVAS